MNFVTKADLKTKPKVKGSTVRVTGRIPSTSTSTSTSASASTSSSNSFSGSGKTANTSLNTSTASTASANVSAAVALRQQQQQGPISIQEKARIEREHRALLRDQTGASLKIQRKFSSFMNIDTLHAVMVDLSYDLLYFDRFLSLLFLSQQDKVCVPCGI